jgi:hypothetical protein
MQTSEVVKQAREYHRRSDDSLVYCGLFGDHVPECVCHLLKKELRTWWKSDLFCRGCFRR